MKSGQCVSLRMDFMHDQLSDGRYFRLLNVIDIATVNPWV